VSNIYGYRARIGYACPPKVAEVFIYEFYKIAPPGVTLAISTVGGGRSTLEELKEAGRSLIAAGEQLARQGVDSVVLGGEPLNAALGDKLPGILESLRERYGIPFTTSMAAQARALQVLGARRIALLSLWPRNERYSPEHGSMDGLPSDIEVVVQKHAPEPKTPSLACIPVDVVPRLAREALEEHPEVDTIKIACAHQASVEAIEAMEQELGVGVMSASLAITWQGLRQAGISDEIPGMGRLLREA
jgi:maleate isomerase